uniref:Uncharacterized protein n=1 Tax=Hemiselmis andersenii TaxID=464988 RepID=A0A7S0U8J0_HEMAN|mmetsp:Transcript_39538/g.92087  ORF Transcript_39538/g.92087 Transcript_39538/m.92087 type:complete len:415 (+) Transcript_39538:141-1385(+)
MSRSTWPLLTYTDQPALAQTASVRKQEEADLVRHSRELLAHDRLGELQGKTRSQIDIGHHDMELTSYVDKLARGDRDAEHDRLSVGSVESEDGEAVGASRARGDDYVPVDGLSAASRRTAAPHIYNIFEQIFMEDAGGRRVSSRAPSLPHDVAYKGWAEQAMVALVLSGQSTHGEVDAALRAQVTADVALCLGIPRDSVSVGPSQRVADGVEVEVVLRTNRGGTGRGPACGELAAELCLQAGELGSRLRAMPATRRALRAEVREVRSPGAGLDLPVAPFGIVTGGLLPEAGRGPRPHTSDIHAGGGRAASFDPRGMSALSQAMSVHEREVERARNESAARRDRDGFWVDVEAGRQRATSQVLRGSLVQEPYGTFTPVLEKEKGGLVRNLSLVGGFVFVALLVWTVYLKYYYGSV